LEKRRCTVRSGKSEALTDRAKTRIGLLCLIVVLISSSGFSATKVSWTPRPLEVEISPGETEMFSAAIHANSDIGDIWIRVVPELEPFIEVSPSTFVNVEAGQTLNIEVTAHADLTAELTSFHGTIQVRSGKRNLASPLPVFLTIVEDPLIGVDANGDGVWDFIERFIDDNYGDSEPTRNALRQFVLTMQLSVANANDPEICVDAATEMQRAIECLHYQRPFDARAIKNDVKAEFLNTPERTFEFLKFNDQLGGQSFPSTPYSELESSCVQP